MEECATTTAVWAAMLYGVLVLCSAMTFLSMIVYHRIGDKIDEAARRTA